MTEYINYLKEMVAKIKEYLETIKNEIQNNWFKNHEATITNEEEFQIIDWNNSTNSNQVIYHLKSNRIHISGHLGRGLCAISVRSDFVNSIKNLSLGNFTENLVCFSEYVFNFNKIEAVKQLIDERSSIFKNRSTRATKKIKRVIIQLINESNDAGEYWFYLKSAYMNGRINRIEYKNLQELGLELNQKVVAYWVGLQMIAEQLEVVSS